VERVDNINVQQSMCVMCCCSATQTELADLTPVEPQLDDVSSLQVRLAMG
jgi:hypothetical protein